MQLKKMRCRPRSPAAAERTGGRNFMPGILGIQEHAETARRIVARSRSDWRRRGCAPIVDAADQREPVVMRLGVAGIEMQGPALLAESKTESLVDGDIARYIVAQHDASPGQGCAT